MKPARRAVLSDTMARYWLAADILKFSGSPEPTFLYAADGPGQEEAFDAFDSRGQAIPCSDPETLKKVMHGKACLNFHVKQWGEGLDEVPLWELREDPRLSFVPEWAWRTVARQRYETTPQRSDAWAKGPMAQRKEMR
jgi:hypothetical protein